MARSTLRVWLRSTRDRSGVCQAHTGPRVIHGERGAGALRVLAMGAAAIGRGARVRAQVRVCVRSSPTERQPQTACAQAKHAEPAKRSGHPAARKRGAELSSQSQQCACIGRAFMHNGM